MNNHKHFYVGTLTGEKYCRVLETGLPRNFGEKYILVEDNDKKHKSPLPTEYKELYGIETLPWPSRSPDLNPIENIWSILKKEYAKLPVEKRGKDERGLEVIIDHIWHSIKLSLVRSLIDSMPKRLQMLKQYKFKPIKY